VCSFAQCTWRIFQLNSALLWHFRLSRPLIITCFRSWICRISSLSSGRCFRIGGWFSPLEVGSACMIYIIIISLWQRHALLWLSLPSSPLFSPSYFSLSSFSISSWSWPSKLQIESNLHTYYGHVWGKSKGVSAIYPWVRFPCLVSYDFGFFLFGGARNELPQASTLTFTQGEGKETMG